MRAADRRALARAISLVEDGDPLAYPLVRELYPSTGRRRDRRRHRAAGRGEVEPHRRARRARPRDGADGRRRLGRSVEPVLARRAARRPHPPLRPLPRPRRLHPLDGNARASRRPRRGDAAGRAPPRRRREGRRLRRDGRRGQSEVEVTGIADTVLLVLMPGSGDSVQALKAGIMEIPDVIAINKMDHPAAKTMLNEVRSIVALAEPERRPTILLTEALTGENVPSSGRRSRSTGRRSRATGGSRSAAGRTSPPRCSRSRRVVRTRISAPPSRRPELQRVLGASRSASSTR